SLHRPAPSRSPESAVASSTRARRGSRCHPRPLATSPMYRYDLDASSLSVESLLRHGWYRTLRASAIAVFPPRHRLAGHKVDAVLSRVPQNPRDCDDVRASPRCPPDHQTDAADHQSESTCDAHDRPDHTKELIHCLRPPDNPGRFHRPLSKVPQWTLRAAAPPISVCGPSTHAAARLRAAHAGGPGSSLRLPLVLPRPDCEFGCTRSCWTCSRWTRPL